MQNLAPVQIEHQLARYRKRVNPFKPLVVIRAGHVHLSVIRAFHVVPPVARNVDLVARARRVFVVFNHSRAELSRRLGYAYRLARLYRTHCKLGFKHVDRTDDFKHHSIVRTAYVRAVYLPFVIVVIEYFKYNLIIPDVYSAVVLVHPVYRRIRYVRLKQPARVYLSKYLRHVHNRFAYRICAVYERYLVAVVRARVYARYLVRAYARRLIYAAAEVYRRTAADKFGTALAVRPAVERYLLAVCRTRIVYNNSHLALSDGEPVFPLARQRHVAARKPRHCKILARKHRRARAVRRAPIGLHAYVKLDTLAVDREVIRLGHVRRVVKHERRCLPYDYVRFGKNVERRFRARCG